MEDGRGGECVCTCTWPATWPAPAGLTVINVPQPGARVEITTAENGALIVSVSLASGELLHQGQTPPIDIASPGWAIMWVSWSDADGLGFRINAVELLRSVDRSVPVTLSLKGQGTGKHVFEDPQLAHVCLPLVRHRAKAYGKAIIQPVHIEMQRLGEVLTCLREDRDRVEAGDVHRWHCLRNTLRSLVVFGRNYDPVLLRIFGHFKMPLPSMLPQR